MDSRYLFAVIDMGVIVLQPIELWTGKQLFSVLVRPHANVRVYVNLTVKEKSYIKPKEEGEREPEAMCPNDGFVYFRNSELISGQLGKATLGKLLHYSFCGFLNFTLPSKLCHYFCSNSFLQIVFLFELVSLVCEITVFLFVWNISCF